MDEASEQLADVPARDQFEKPTHLPCILLNACTSDHNAFNLEWLGVTLPKCSCALVRSILGRGEVERLRAREQIGISISLSTL